jgi:uncharacterized membrane protein YciS (DUF1049 family)
MNLLKGTFIFLIAFVSACILIFTFMQEPFRQLVPGRILFWSTPAIPIWAYVAGAFTLGLTIGLLTTLYYFIVLQARLHKKNRAISDLEEQLLQVKITAEQGAQIPEAGANEQPAVPAQMHSNAVADARQEGGLL